MHVSAVQSCEKIDCNLAQQTRIHGQAWNARSGWRRNERIGFFPTGIRTGFRGRRRIAAKTNAVSSSPQATRRTRQETIMEEIEKDARTHARTHALTHTCTARTARPHTRKTDGGHTCSSVKGPSFPRDTAFFALPLLSCIVPEPPPHRRTNFCAFIDEQNPKDTILVHASSNMVSGGKQHRQPATETPPGCPAAPPFAVKDPSLPLLPPPPLVNIYPSRLSLYLPVSLSPCLPVSLSHWWLWGI